MIGQYITLLGTCLLEGLMLVLSFWNVDQQTRHSNLAMHY